MYVKDVEISSQEQDTQPQTPSGMAMLLVLCCSAAVLLSGKSAFSFMDSGQTELPTCPVCLERLDEHISGVVTTVSICE